MQLCILSADGTQVGVTQAINPATSFANLLSELDGVVEGCVLWLKAARHDRAVILVRTRKGWKSMMKTDSRWSALHKRKLDGGP